MRIVSLKRFMARTLIYVIACVALVFLPGPVLSEDKQENVLSSILKSLEILQKDPAVLENLSEQIKNELHQGKQDLEALNQESITLQEQLHGILQRKAELENRLNTLHLGQALIENLPAESSNADVEQETPKESRPVEQVPQAENLSTDDSGILLYTSKVQPLLMVNCMGCHNPGNRMSEFDITSRDGLFNGGKRGPAIVSGNARNSLLVQLIRHETTPHMPLSMEKLPDEDIRSIEQWIDAGAPFDEKETVTESKEAAKVSVKPKDEDPPHTTISDHVGGEVDFARDVFPIFESKCLACHGENQQSGQLRLDSKNVVEQGGLSGNAVVPGNAEESQLLRRILGLDNKPHMPFQGEKLVEAEIEKIKGWIDQGAYWPEEVGVAHAEIKKHWAYIAPVKADFPDVKNQDWARNPIDLFILSRLEKEGLEPSPEASKETLIRRLSLDLIGLPPMPEEIDAFLADESPDAYEILVDRLLSSPHYGEKWAKQWLDLARYADSNGYEKDAIRSMWPYRDWVINAINEDKPYDEFVIEQMAGDLLSNPSRDQLIATGFHRNTMINEEGGVDQEQFRVEAVLDRVNTTATVFMGSTMACAQCHDHKFDPISQKDYYQMMAFFNSTEEEVLRRSSFEAVSNGPLLELTTPEQEEIIERVQPELDLLKALFIIDTTAVVEGQKLWEKKLLAQQQEMDARLAADPDTKEPTQAAPQNILDILRKPIDERERREESSLRRYYRENAAEYMVIRDRIAELNEEMPKNIPTTLIMRELDTPRDSHVFMGGSFLSPGEKVQPDVPKVLPPLPQDAPRDRLSLALWLVNRENPLTARVTVNLIWEQYFGMGIVKTTEDFGIQGEFPVHPELLDWLAVKFMEGGWSRKSLHRLIVTSSTYRQSTQTTPELQENDPENRLLARFSRFRLDAEIIRDNALTIGGLLSRELGGPSVFPYQPPGVWRMPYNSEKWEMNEDDDRYRRGLYVHWRRTATYPSFAAFDAPLRGSTCTRRPRTNTPLQALVTMNDPVYFEAAQALARRVLDRVGLSLEERIDYAFRLCTARYPSEPERKRIHDLYEQQMDNYKNDKEAAMKVATEGTELSAEGYDMAELAAWTLVSNVLLNLDETLTKG